MFGARRRVTDYFTEFSIFVDSPDLPLFCTEGKQRTWGVPWPAPSWELGAWSVV